MVVIQPKQLKKNLYSPKPKKKKKKKKGKRKFDDMVFKSSRLKNQKKKV